MPKELTRDERLVLFHETFAKIKGERSHQVKTIADVLNVEENTVRGWMVQEPHRVINQPALNALVEYVKTGNRPVILHGQAYARSEVEKALKV